MTSHKSLHLPGMLAFSCTLSINQLCLMVGILLSLDDNHFNLKARELGQRVRKELTNAIRCYNTTRTEWKTPDRASE